MQLMIYNPKKPVVDVLKDEKNTPLTNGTKLCLECGLCCIGVFHNRALIYTQEDKACVKAFNGIFLFHDEKEWFKLPCPVYEGKCTIYPQNPTVCQKHECNLLKKINNNEIKLEKAITVVHEMKKIINNIENDFKSFSFKTDEKEITLIFKQFFASTSKEKRKDFGNLLKEYATFLHLKKKYFYN